VRIALLGATGTLGPYVLDRALEDGDDVTVLARTPSKVSRRPERLAVVDGDVLDPDAVERAVAGHDGAIWLVSGPNVRRSEAERWVCRDGSRNVVDALSRTGAGRRFVVVSSWGARDSRRRVPLPLRPMIVNVMLREELRDKNAQEKLVEASDLDWTIVRPSRMTSRNSGSPRVARRLAFFPWASTSRPLLADFLVRITADGSHVREIVEFSTAGARVKT
jgi:uncharacterized protein YbjT (DUF2867 family)